MAVRSFFNRFSLEAGVEKRVLISVTIYQDETGLFGIIKFPNDRMETIPHPKILSAEGPTVLAALKNLTSAADEQGITLPEPFRAD